MGLSNNLVRIITGIVGIPVVLITAYLGGWWFFGLVAVLALVAQTELYHLLRAAGAAPNVILGLGLGTLVLLRLVFEPALGIALGLLIAAIALSPFFGVSQGGRGAADTPGTRRDGPDEPLVSTAGGGDPRFPEASTPTGPRPTPGGPDGVIGRSGAPLSLAATVLGVVYPTLLLGFLAEIRGGPGLFDADQHGFALTAATLFLVWTTDTMAYFVGRAIGKRPFAPRISPKKTWEGTVGGAVSALLVGAILKLSWISFLGWADVLIVAAICGIVGQLGDLAESKMKRVVGVKDSGSLLPGHGGMLDRFDSMILVAPAVYLYLRYAATLAA